jgi:uncharacterized protein (TIGR00106 family)
MLFSVSVVPVGKGDALAHPVAEVIEEIEQAGLSYQVTAMDTVIEGSWDEVVPVIRRAQQRLLEEYPRVLLTLTVDEHRGVPPGRLTASVDDIDRELGHDVAR